MQPAAVIFDMDGVLIDSEPLHLDATNEVLAREGAHLTPLENEPFLGTNELAYWRALAARFGLAEDPEHYVVERKNVLIRILRELLPVAEGIPDFLGRLADRGIPMAVASGSGLELVRFVVKKAGLGEYLPVLAGGDEVANPKPAPDVFLLAAERLGVEAGRCLVFEDSPNGVHAALAAGMTCVRVVTQTTRALEFPSTYGEIDSFVGLQVDQITGGSLADPLS